MLCVANCAASPSWATSVLATTSSPDVSLSIRCTIPGRATPPMPLKPPGAMVEQGVDQSAVEIAGGGMDDHPGRLVDDEQMLVLEDDLERDILRLVMRGPRLRNGDFIGARPPPSPPDRAPARPAGRAPRRSLISAFSRSRDKRRHRGRQRAVEPPARGVLGDPGLNDGMPPRHRSLEMGIESRNFKVARALASLNRKRPIGAMAVDRGSHA